jgi:CPA1 family monovalent cation:H+ antiporter
VALTVIATRLAWIYSVPSLIRLVDRRPQQRARRLSARARLPIAWSGFRGGVSLAAALAVPVTTADGSPLQGRDLIIVVTFGVILVTLLGQGLTLPAVLRWARLPSDHDVVLEQQLAERTATEAALAALPTISERLGSSEESVVRLRAELEERLNDLADEALNADGSTPEDGRAGRSAREDYRVLHRALIREKRGAVIGLRDTRLIDDIVLRRVQARLDAEEVRLSPSPEPEPE